MRALTSSRAQDPWKEQERGVSTGRREPGEEEHGCLQVFMGGAGKGRGLRKAFGAFRASEAAERAIKGCIQQSVDTCS
ncbi:uncharacterized protein T551_00637 [Pneumocystis jirovecii RU7]|uniref:Uncharacterized protein n=1 Tax=Pneumocystis jirovecii (strain RU7) TaxID=1408657 RepID=A0A0W4ZUA2_PNEJ7|nr:uncharacterized protein T551_00637 [Pneumocystis jirovecii RU7]KTW31954.1 hypothetical protein T551_00637 [Pneumocystis jirovecii RU7]